MTKLDCDPLDEVFVNGMGTYLTVFLMALPFKDTSGSSSIVGMGSPLLI